MGKYKKLILGSIALALLAVKVVFGFEVPFEADAVYGLVVAVLGAFGIYKATNE